MQVMRVRTADAVTWLRLLLLPVIWVLAMLGHGRLVGAGLVLAGVTDFLDGYLARRLGQESSAGARLDAIADILLLLSATIWIGLLHPEILAENQGLVAATAIIYSTSLAVSRIRFRRLGNLHLYSSRAAGGLLYTFATLTLVLDDYSRLLLAVGASALTVSAIETMIANLLLSAVDERLGSVLLVRRRRAELKDHPRHLTIDPASRFIGMR